MDGVVDRRALRAAALAVLILGSALVMASPARASFAFQEGLVSVNGYNWESSPVKVQLADISPTNGGKTSYTIYQILQQAQGSTSDFDLATVPQIDIFRPGSSIPIRCSGDEMRAESSRCPTFTSTPDATYMRLKSGATVKYEVLSPEIFISKGENLKVVISPRSKQIKSGQTVTFKAEVGNVIGDVTYKWNFGDGTSKTTSDGTITHKFTGADRTFHVVVQVTATGNARDDSDVAVITTGKPPKKKPEKKQEPEKTDDGGTDPPADSGTYVPGYDDYGDGTGTGTGSPSTDSGSPADPGPKQKHEQKPAPPVDDGLETVSGELIGPGTTATVIPPADSTGTSGEEASPAEDDSSGGGGMPKGVTAALGIGALLGLGGLAEAGAFSGFRRFRFRP